MPFWTAVDGVSQDPKRESRFKVQISSLNQGDSVWYAKSFTKPSATISTTKHKYLNHTFNYPGSVEWSEVTIELVDPTDPIDTAGSLAQLLMAMGYSVPSVDTDLINISKRKGVASLGDISVSHIDDQGNAIETWTLQQAFVSKFEWGSLKYDSDNLNTLKLTIKYDWAICSLSTGENDPIESESVVVEKSDGSYFVKGLVRPTTRA